MRNKNFNCHDLAFDQFSYLAFNLSAHFLFDILLKICIHHEKVRFNIKIAKLTASLMIRSILPSSRSVANHLSHSNKYFFCVSVSVISTRFKNHSGKVPVLSCLIRIEFNTPRLGALTKNRSI
jgi:hypothetical protein